MGLSKQVKLKIFLSISLFLVISSFLCYIGLPTLIEFLIKKQLILTPSSVTFQNWKDIKVPIYMKIYLFNITNVNEVLENSTKPTVEQLGPYTFLEKRQKVNISWNHSNGTVEYRDYKAYTFLSQLSNGSLDDPIVHLNPTLVATANDIKLREEGREIIYETINAIMTSANLELYPLHNVSQLLFDGYFDELLYAAKQLKFKVPYDKFGWFYPRNRSTSAYKTRIFTGENNTMDKFGLMNTFNDEIKFHNWNGHNCNKFDQSTPGDFQPPFEQRREKIYLFLGDLCRTLPLTFLKEVDYRGLKLHRYWLSDKTFDYEEESNQCYCTKTSCPLKGLFNASTCSMGSPIFVSMPHFLYSDSNLLSNIDGLNPNPDEHIFFADFEPTLGVFVNVKARLQINMLIEKDENLIYIEDLPNEKLYFPIFWTETTTEIDDEMIEQMKIVQSLPNLIVIIVFTQLTLAALILIVTFICSCHNEKENSTTTKCNYETVKLQPVDNVRPMIRKMTTSQEQMNKLIQS